jgi:hypothetical protein
LVSLELQKRAHSPCCATPRSGKTVLSQKASLGYIRGILPASPDAHGVRQSFVSERSAATTQQEVAMQMSPVPIKPAGEAVEHRQTLQRAGSNLLLALEPALDASAAWRKSAEILTRSLGVWNAAFSGVAWVTMEDAFAAGRGRLSCSSLGSLADLERELTIRTISKVTARVCLLLTIALQIIEETAYPLQRLVGLELEKLTPAGAG